MILIIFTKSAAYLSTLFTDTTSRSMQTANLQKIWSECVALKRTVIIERELAIFAIISYIMGLCVNVKH